jgi:WG containing repeat
MQLPTYKQVQKILTSLLLLLITTGVKAQKEPPGLIYAGEQLVNGKISYELFDHRGKKIFPNPVDRAYSNAWSWIMVVNNNTQLKTGYDFYGKPLGVDSIEETKSVYANVNRLAAKRKGKWGFYNRQGQLRIPHQFDSVSCFYEYVAAVKKDGQAYLVDTTGKRLDMPYHPKNQRYNFGDEDIATGMFGFYNPNYTIVKKEQKKGLTDKQNNILIPVEYDELYSLKEKLNLVTVKKNGKYGLVAFGGKIIIPVQYQRLMVLNDYFY